MNSRIKKLLVGIVVGALVLSSCGATTFDNTISTTTTPIDVTVTTLPTGPITALLPQLVTAMTELSSFIGPNQSGQTKSGKADQLNLINNLWAAIETELIVTDPDSAESLGRMIELSNYAVTASHPADADKAAKFAGQVVDFLLTTNS